MSIRRFKLAPMSRGILLLTCALFLVPAGLLYMALMHNKAMLVPAALVASIYLLVWIYFRPTRFELSEHELTIVWPIRRSTVPLARIEGSEIITGETFRSRYGWPMRVGAGGLWGGFGLLLTRQGKLRFYISRLDRYVLVHCREEKPLLITPERPDEFLQSLEAHIERA